MNIQPTKNAFQPVDGVVHITPLLRVHLPTGLELEINKYVSDFVKRQRAIDAGHMHYFTPAKEVRVQKFQSVPAGPVLRNAQGGHIGLMARDGNSYRGARRNQQRIAYRQQKAAAA